MVLQLGETRRTKAMIARENGLEPLLRAILADRGADPETLAQATTFVLTIEPVPDPDAAPSAGHYLAGFGKFTGKDAAGIAAEIIEELELEEPILGSDLIAGQSDAQSGAYTIRQLVGYEPKADPEYSHYGGIRSTSPPASLAITAGSAHP